MNTDITCLPSNTGNDTFFSGKYRDAIFSDKMIRYPNANGHKDEDIVQSYDINSLGYRSPEFSIGADLLFAGCSFTYGMGVPENGIWGSVVADRLGLTYNNLSQNAASIPWLVKQIFAYFNEFGNPKVLLCLFPPLTRTFFPSNPEILISKASQSDYSTEDSSGEKSIFNIELSSMNKNSSRPSYSKKPHYVEDVLSTDFLVYTSMQSIRMLEQYCSSSGIQFLWGSWHHPFCSIMEGPVGLTDRYNFNSYVKTGYDMWKDKDNKLDPDVFGETPQSEALCLAKHDGGACSCYDCHSDLSNLYGDAFYKATDTLRGHPHFGVHRHIHIAESFINRLEAN
jgi:hypothetical protein